MQNSPNGVLEGGYNLTYGSWIFRPNAGMQYLNLNQTGFSEANGGGANLRVGSQSSDALWLSAGLRAGRPFYSGDWTILPALHVKYLNDVIGDDVSVNSGFVGVGGAYRVRGVGAGRNFGIVGMSLAAEQSRWLRLVGDVSYQASTSQQSTTGSGGVELRW